MARSGRRAHTGTTPFVAGIYIVVQKEREIYGSAQRPNLSYLLP